jgi:crotonobetainyl-CoA:carnitine CoA-transferase CaiB-like acyl-CoA transferase
MGGIMGITGPNAGTPTKVGPGVGDLIPAMFGTIGILSAVIHARDSGEGQFVDVSMVDSVLAVCERIVYQHSVQGILAKPEGNHHPFLVPFGLFPARDGWVSIACPSNAFWKILCKQLGMEGLLEDPRFKTPAERASNAKPIIDSISLRTKELTKDELKEKLGGKIPFGPVYDMADITTDPHFKARDMVVEVENPGLDVPIAIAGVPIRMTRTPGGVHTRAPFLGEHTEEVLTASGFSSDQIEIWRETGVIK